MCLKGLCLNGVMFEGGHVRLRPCLKGMFEGGNVGKGFYLKGSWGSVWKQRENPLNSKPVFSDCF